MKKIHTTLLRKSKLITRVAAVLIVALCVQAAMPFVASVLAAMPTISNISTTSILSTSTTVNWTTDVVSNTQIEYGTTTAYGASTALVGTLVTNHSQNLTGLAANQLYHYKVKSRDASGDLAVSGDRTFITALGATTPGSSTDSSNSRTMNTSKFTTGNGGKVGSLSVHVGAVDPSADASTRNYQLAIYAANGNVPGAFIASTPIGSLNSAGNTWNTIGFPNNSGPTLAPSTGYFIAYNTNASADQYNNMHYTSGGTSGWINGGQAFGQWPATFTANGTFMSQSATFSLYASFVGDTTPPTVSISSPTETATVSGITTITANASDDTSVASVQFKVGTTDLGIDTSAPYTAGWDTTRLLNSTQALTAIATDTAGNITTSTVVNVTTSNPAKITVNQPTSGQDIAGTSVTVTYTKTGDWLPGDGKHAHFRVDGGTTKMDFDTDNNQSYTLIDIPGGSHILEAIIADGSHVELPGSGMSAPFTTTAPDTTPPTVSLTTPLEGTTVQNNITVTADAADDRTVVGVQFLLDGNTLGSEDTTAPYSVNWNTTTVTNGSHALTARARDSVNQTISPPITVNVQNTDPRAVVGEWSNPVSWPLVAVHTTLLKTGKVLIFDAWESPTSFAKLWDPANNTFTPVTANAGLFCAGQVTDANGNFIAVGGHTPDGAGILNVMSFNPDTLAWTRKTNLQTARWYPTAIQQPDNKIAVFSGQRVQGTFVNTAEVFNPTANTISTLPFSTPELHEIQYPQASVLTSGRTLLVSTEVGGMFLYDSATGTRSSVIGTTQVPYGVWTSFAKDKFLITGGGSNFNSYVPHNGGISQKTARILDMSSGSPVWTTAPNMNFGRSFHNLTMLPDGKALAVGGSTTVDDYSDVGTTTAEMWDPTSNTWTQMDSPVEERMYHSTSLLLPDGRLLSAGGGRLPGITDHFNAEIFSPPYLFKGPRPTITTAPSTIGYGSTMDLVSPNAADISKISFVNLGSITHTADWNQNFMELSFTRNGDTLTVNTPSNVNVARENYYMVFIVNGNGVPSEAKIVKLGGVPDTTAPVISNVQATNLTSVSATISWTTNEASDTQVEFGTTTSYGSSTNLDTTQVLSHSQNLPGLAPSTLYHYRVKSRDTAGNLTVSPDFTFTSGAADTQAPTVSVTAPASGSTVSGLINIDATASDDTGVVGVQFKIDAVNLNSEDTTSPYSTPWNTTLISNGSHIITAVARDAAGNTRTSSIVRVTVSNSGGTSLVGAWNFNEGSGIVANDTSGSGNIGSLSGATWYTAGKFGKALSFNGTSNHVSVNDSNSLDLTNRMTMEAWVRPTASSGWRTIMMKENGNELAYGMYARESTNRPAGWMRVNPTSGSSQSVGATPGLTLNTWSHMAATYDGSSFKLYINGTLRATRAQTGNMYTSTSPLKFGGNGPWGEYFAGQLDEIRLYNRTLTQAEIQTNMNQPL